MSTGFQDRMYNYEVTPPAGVWERIVPALDDAALNKKFPATLQQMEVSPPAGSWDQIAMALDEEQLVADFSAKLSGISIPPPPGAWQKIKAQLETAPEIQIPQQRRIPPVFRYAIAASIIGLLTWGAFQLFNGKKEEIQFAKENGTGNTPVSKPANQTTVIPEGDFAIDDITASLEEARNDAALEASKKTIAKLDPQFTKSKIRNAADFYFISDETNQPGTRGLGEWQPPVTKQDLSDRYFTLMTPDGNIIRISKKLSDIVGCVAGAEQDADCLDQLKKWREQLANPKSVHSSGNLLEILNLANSLENN